ncbi:methyltransferase [Candidatus Kapabacteria bacterium]|nr:methyltransferase [Candidatus Kapabacteria bacterium]
MKYINKDKKFEIKRYPKTNNTSLLPWNSSEEHILNYLHDNNLLSSQSGILIINDRFGFLSCLLSENNPNVIIEQESQKKSISENYKLNSLNLDNLKFLTPLEKSSQIIDLILLKIPKSNDLFKLYLNQIIDNIDENTTVVCGFMTKHFNNQLIDIAKLYFEDISQSLAWKKSRLLILRKPIKTEKSSIVNTFRTIDDDEISQYYGVFSSNKIDRGTEFLLNKLKVLESESTILDLGSGNGIIAKSLQKQSADSEIHLIDDSILAIESAKMNIKGDNVFFHCDDTLKSFENKKFDLIVCNPPFHFGYETNIEISIGLFKESKAKLNSDGRFVLVANTHLNYGTHLSKIFNNHRLLSSNLKYQIHECKN